MSKEGVLRVDIVFDVYRDLSLKQETRERRGTDGMRISLRKETPIQHKIFRKVITVGENKTALFNMIADAIALIQCETIIVSTRQSSVVSNIPLNYSRLQPCNQEEADTRLFLHAKDASTNGIKKIMIITVDTDVVVIALFVFCSLNVQELWIEFGSGKNKKWLPIHQYAKIFGQEKCRALEQSLEHMDGIPRSYPLFRKTVFYSRIDFRRYGNNTKICNIDV